MFLAQALNEDRSCQKAVNDAAIQRIVGDLPTVSTATGGYCRARQRLPLTMVSGLVCQTGKLINSQVPEQWSWQGRRVHLIDGTTVTMPDTEENQAVYPQQSSQKPGLGFPICRLVGVICLSSGAVLNASIGQFKGKGAGEQSVLRNIMFKGSIVNASKLGTSLGVTHHTIKNYLYILEETFMIRLLNPYHSNLKKRLVKSPKMYIRDSGIVHALLQIETYNELFGHPVYGFSFEGFVIESLINHHPKHEPFFYRTATGDEIDLLLIKGQEILAFEIKSSTSPQVEKGFWNCIRDIQPFKTVIIAQVDSPYPYKGDIIVYDLDSYLRQ